MPRTASCLLAALVSAAVLVGCGGTDSAAGPSPAGIVPPSALAYVEVTFRPEGDVREGALAAAGKILDTTDPGPKLRELVDKLIAEADDQGPDATYAKDVEPWLGDRGALWVAREIVADEDAAGAAIAVKDAEEAKAFVERETTPDDKQRSYRGVDYVLDPDNTAVAVVDDRLLIGGEAQLQAMIDISEDGKDALADTDAYKEAVDRLSDERLGHVYLDLDKTLELAAASDPTTSAVLEQMLGNQKVQPLAIGLLADGERIALESVSSADGGGLLGAVARWQGSGGSPLIDKLPDGAWVAMAFPDVGKNAKTVFDEAAGALGGVAITQAIREQTGLDLHRDVFSWIGDVGLFVRGDTPDSLDGAIVIESIDDAAAERAFGRIVAAVVTPDPVSIQGAESAFSIPAGLPQPVIAARAKGRVVLAVGEKAAIDALAGGGGSQLVEDARATLGDVEPIAVVGVAQALALARAAGAASDPDFAHAEKYIDAFSTLALGSEVKGDESRSVFSLGLE
jgi:hypothetical protein